jgi:hypothetical protein
VFGCAIGRTGCNWDECLWFDSYIVRLAPATIVMDWDLCDDFEHWFFFHRFTLHAFLGNTGAVELILGA